MGGFIPGSRGSFMLDVVAVAMIAILPLLAVAIQAAKSRKYDLHKRIMITLGAVLLLAVLAFEIEMRSVGWRHLAEPSPYYESLVFWSLGIHLIFSITAAASIVITLGLALKNFPSHPAPGPHSVLHRRLGKIAVISLTCTAVTGWIFYYLAFVAT